MTGLHRTHMTTSQKVEFSAKAVANIDRHGTISQLSQDYQISRPTAYKAVDDVWKLLQGHYSKSEEEHQAVNVTIDKQQLHRAIIALRVIAPNSIRSIEDLLPIIYPGLKFSYGSIQGILSEAEDKAKEFNSREDLSAIKHSALDEMYSQGNPVLAGIDLDSGYLHSLELRDSRSGTDWAEVLNTAKQQGLDLNIVVKDAAIGIETGVKEVFPKAQQRDDCFHVLYDSNKVRRKLKSRAYTAIDYEYSQKKKLGKIRAKDKNQRKAQRKKIEQATLEASRRIEQYDEFTKAHHLIRESMEYVHPETGQRYTGDGVQQMMRKAAEILSDIDYSDCRKLATYIQNRSKGIALAAQALSQQFNQLNSTYSETDIDSACLITRLVTSKKKHSGGSSRYNRQDRFLLGLYSSLINRIGDKADGLFATINALLEKRYRASSAIEGFNAALRPYLYVHKGVTQDFLELFRAYYNLRIRRWGRHKNTSAHEGITGKRVSDWLSMIGYTPSTANSLPTAH